MEEIFKKLEQLNTLIKALKSQSKMHQLPTMPTIKPPAPPSMKAASKQGGKMPGLEPGSKKDPKKIAEQIKSGAMSTKTQKVMLKAHDGGQWSLDDIEKADKIAEEKYYHIHQGPHRITSQPVTLDQIRKRHGSVQKLENSGFTLIPHNPKPKP